MRQWLFPALSVLALLALAGLASRPTAAGPAAITPLPPVEHPDGRAGACYSFFDNPERPYVQMALDAGSRWDRFDFIWANLEPANDVWDQVVLDGYDSLVSDLDDAGMDMVGILLWTPDWAATSGLQGMAVPRFDQRPAGWYAPAFRSPLAPLAPTAASSPPQGLYLPWDDPGNYWGDFVYDVVSRYGGTVKHWEMWNEAEWSYFWTGSEADYAQLLRVGYQATRAACPDCTVFFAGLHYWADPTFFERVLDILNDDPDAPANNYFFDVMSVHLYSTSDSTYSIVNNIRSRMTVYVPDHPIWLTETGVPVWDDGAVDPDPTEYDWAATQDEAAAYVIQSYANGWASDVERYFFFRTNDEDMSEYFGLIRNDHSLRPAYVAYQVANTYLVSPTFTTRASDGAIMRVALWGTPRGKVSVLWNTTPTQVSYDYDATLSTATRVDRWGVTQTITATGGVYSLDLPAATANLVSNPNHYFIGGDPLIVIEAETVNEPPTSTVHSLPTATYSSTINVTWEGHDNQSGVWLYDIQVRDGISGTWEYWKHSTTATSGQFAGQHDHTYYFRSRATDRVGNREEWPAEAQACTTVNLNRTVHFDLRAVFGDENSNGVRDGDEITLTEDMSFHFVDVSGTDVVSPTIGSSWEFTATLLAGDYNLVVIPTDWWSPAAEWLPRWLPVIVEPGETIQEIALPEVGLFPHVCDRFLPVVFRSP